LTEIDLDAIPNTVSSAKTLSGFSVEESGKPIFFGKTKMYLPQYSRMDLGEEKNTHLIGKLIGYLVTDFIKANNRNI
jgi:formiminoglutamase